jgi:hypothetical protein
MSYARATPKVFWDRPGPFQGLTIRHPVEGQLYEWRIPWNGAVTQAMAADILEVSLATVNSWINTHALLALKAKGHPSVIPLREIKRIRKILLEYGRLHRDALGE